MIRVTSDESKEHKGSYGLEQVSRIRSYFGLKRMRGQSLFYKLIEWEIHSLILCMWMISYLLVVMSIYYRQRKEVLVLKRVFSVECLSLKVSTFKKRRKGVLEISHGHAEKKSLKHACRENLRLFLLSRVMELGTLVFHEIT